MLIAVVVVDVDGPNVLSLLLLLLLMLMLLMFADNVDCVMVVAVNVAAVLKLCRKHWNKTVN